MTRLDERQKVFLAIAIVFCSSLLYTLFHQIYTAHSIKGPCNLAQQVCTVMIGQKAQASLEITPKAISPDSRVGLKVKLIHLPAEQVVLDIINGENPNCASETRLTTDDSENYFATASVPTCAVATSHWLFVVHLLNGPNAYGIPFRLILKTAK